MRLTVDDQRVQVKLRVVRTGSHAECRLSDFAASISVKRASGLSGKSRGRSDHRITRARDTRDGGLTHLTKSATHH